MKSSKSFIDLTLFIFSIILVSSYFLPVEASWAPVDSWQGYWAGGMLMKGLDIIILETAPYAVGLIILIVLATFRWTKIVLLIETAFSLLWIMAGTIYIYRILYQPNMNFPLLWSSLIAGIGISLLFFLFYFVMKIKQEKFIWIFLASLAIVSLLQQSCSIAFYLLEDKLLLNIGSVIGITAANCLVIILMFRLQINNKLKVT